MVRTSRFAVLSLVLAFFTMGFIDLMGVVSNYLKADLGLTDTVANIVPSLVFFWFLIFAVPTGLLMNKIGRRRTVMLSVALTILAMLIPVFSAAYVPMLIGSSLLGLGNALIQTSLNPLVAGLITGNRLPSALSFGHFVKSIAPFFAPYLAMWGAAGILPSFGLGWRVMFLVYGLVGIVTLLLLVTTKIEEPPSERNVSMRECWALLRKPVVVLSFVGIMCHVGIDVGTNITAPKILMERLTLTLNDAEFATSLYFIFRALGCLVGAYLLRVFSHTFFFSLSIVLMALGVAGLFHGTTMWVLYMSIALMGLGNSNLFSLILSQVLLSEPHRQNEVSGLMIMGLFGGTIFPLLIGVAADAVGQLGAVIVIGAGVLYLASYLPYIKTLAS